MGMTWARSGCLVLVMDQLGHGERRQHPFRTEADYPRPFRVGRQDYYFRYNTGVQLHLVGESLMGWMAWDLMRGVDLLLSRPGIDRDRIILLGAVAGGGDPAAVTAALDPRVTAVVPFNFGGPQPDTPSPTTPSGISTGSAAPSGNRPGACGCGARRLRPVGDRRVRGAAAADLRPRVRLGPGARPGLAAAPEDLRLLRRRRPPGRRRGPGHPQGHAAGEHPLQQHRPVPPQQDLPDPGALVRHADPRGVQQEAGGGRAAVPDAGGGPGAPAAAASRAGGGGGGPAGVRARRRLARLGPEERRRRLREDWARLLGDVEPKADPKVRRLGERYGDATVERIVLDVGRGVVVPVLLLVPPHGPEARPPVVLGLSQDGKQAFLAERSGAIAELLGGGAAVCLVDVRGTGETRPRDGSRRYNGAAAAISAAS